MKRHTLPAIALAVLTVAGTSLPAMAMAADGPEGTWKITSNRGRVSILRLQVDAGKLTGELLDHQGPRSDIENASYADGRISFEVSQSRRGETYTVRYRGMLKGDKIEGTTEVQRPGRSWSSDWQAIRTTPQPVADTLSAPPVAADIDLTKENYQLWRDHILPETNEMAWTEIPWLTTFKDGILAADNAGKPLLLWTMNGHPLGCT